MEAQEPTIKDFHNKHERQWSLFAEGRQAPSRVLFSPFIFYNPKHLFRGSLRAPREHPSWRIPVRNGVETDAAFRVGYFCQLSLKSTLTDSRETDQTQQFLFFWTIMFRESYPLLLGYTSREGGLVVRFLEFKPKARYPSQWMRWGSYKGFRRTIEWTPAEPWWLLSVMHVMWNLPPY